MTTNRPVGELLRSWRQRRHLSQLDLAVEAEVSARHVSFVETGRAQPSREMLLHLAEKLDIPLRDRNALLTAAGYAPVYPQRTLDDPALRNARQAIDLVLTGHEPYPAIAVDRHWTLMSANRAVAPLLRGVAPQLLQPPANALRISLHPDGLAPRIANLAQWRSHVVTRLRHQVDVTGDAQLAALLDELLSYPAPARGHDSHDAEYYAGVVVPLRLHTDEGLLSMFSTTTLFGTPLDITLAELAIESFFPADPETAAILRRVGEAGAAPNAMQ